MRDRIRGLFILIFFCAGGVMIFFSYRESRPFAEEKIRQKAVREAVVQEAESPMDRKIDFEMLKHINEDIIGWLYIPQIGVDTPILRGNTDEEYLAENFEGEYSPLGSIFTYSHTDEKLSDPHFCLFGHNMPSGQMFGRLSEFADDEFCRMNNTYWLYTPERTKKIVVQKVCEVKKDDAVFQDDWEGGPGEVQTVTLAACAGYGNTPLRIAVTGAVEEEKIIL